MYCTRCHENVRIITRDTSGVHREAVRLTAAVYGYFVTSASVAYPKNTDN